MATNKWSIEKAQAWYNELPWLVGCNFIPSTAINQLEMWQADTFDPETIDRELGWAAGIGMNTVRVFLHDLAWLQDPEGFKQRIHQYLEIASKHGIRTMFVLFDDCWHPNATIGKQPEPVPGVHNSGWLQSPGLQAANDPAQEPRLKAYVQDVVGTFAQDPRVLIWDLYNELGNTFLPIMTKPWYKKYPLLLYRGFRHLFLPLPTLPLLQKTAQWVRELQPMQPLTAGIWFGSKALNDALIEVSDIISFHNYFKAPALSQQIKYLQQFKRPLLCTEYMSRTSGSLFETHLPIFQKENVGCYNWGLVNGKTQTIYTWEDIGNPAEPAIWFHDIFREDGTPFSTEEINFIRKMTNQKS